MVYKTITAAMLLLLLTGCEHTQPWAQRFSFLQGSPASAESFDFNWQLSGDREVAPLQVFSTPQKIWLQFAPDQPVPAIFAVDNQQQKVMSYQRNEPYVVITGGWQQLLFKGASLEAKAVYTPAVLSSVLATDPIHIETVVTDSAPEINTELYPIETVEINEPAFDFKQIPFHAEPDDKTLRQTLKRWAQREGWLFQDQHWELEVDLPIVSAATFSPSFNDSVEQLMRSTALSNRPLQACFYSNKVMRVIALAQSCDPNESPTTFTQG